MVTDTHNGSTIDVVIIGGGPAGLSAATELKRLGVAKVVVLERETSAGGIPRHCGHPPFGMREFTRVLTGPAYARKLVKTALAAGVDIRTSTTVVEAQPGGKLLLTTPDGVGTITAKRVIYATGVRETPRSARLISGNRPLGVINTGALQSMVFLEKLKPFKRPVILGSELVSFSAIQTCHHAGISPVAMIEETGHTMARWPSGWFAKINRIPLHYNSHIASIEGEGRVEAVIVENNKGDRETIRCDGVIVSGNFTPEASLARCGHLRVDQATGGPVVDQYGRCSDTVYFATGNVLRPVETAGWSWNEGRQSARIVARDLAGELPDPEDIVQILATGPIVKYVMPQNLSRSHHSGGQQNLQLRFTRRAKGTLVLSDEAGTIWSRKMKALPERRVLVPIAKLAERDGTGPVKVRFEETGS